MADGTNRDVDIRVLTGADAATFRQLRLEGLRSAPEAFGSTYDEYLAVPLDTVAARLIPSRAPLGRVVVGAFVGGALVGCAGCIQSEQRKLRHTATIWGMYVRPDQRGRGTGRLLLAEIVAEAHAWSEVDRLVLTVVERAAAARRVYDAAGFEVFGREADGMRDGDVRDTVEHRVLVVRR